MSLSVTVLGSSGSFASPENPCTGYLLRSPGATVLLDCGPGTLGPLQREIDLGELTAIVLTHCHPDHWLELPVLRNVFLYFVPRADVPVFGTAETRRLNDEVQVGARSPFVWTDIDAASDVAIGDQRWRFASADHPVETLGPRVDWADRSFAFTADSGPGWSYEPLSVDGPIDVAFSDASHLQTSEGRGIPHMSAREAGLRAAEGGVERLVITHLVPGADPEAYRAEAEAAYGGPVEVALPGCTFEI